VLRFLLNTNIVIQIDRRDLTQVMEVLNRHVRLGVTTLHIAGYARLKGLKRATNDVREFGSVSSLQPDRSNASACAAARLIRLKL